MTFDEAAFMEERRLQAERELGIKIDPIDWSTGTVIPPPSEAFEIVGRMSEENERRIKLRLAMLIKHTIRRLDLTQEQVAEFTSLSQPDVSNIVRASLKKYSVLRLLDVLMALGGHVTLRLELPKQAMSEGATPSGRLSLETG